MRSGSKKDFLVSEWRWYSRFHDPRKPSSDRPLDNGSRRTRAFGGGTGSHRPPRREKGLSHGGECEGEAVDGRKEVGWTEASKRHGGADNLTCLPLPEACGAGSGVACGDFSGGVCGEHKAGGSGSRLRRRFEQLSRDCEPGILPPLRKLEGAKWP